MSKKITKKQVGDYINLSWPDFATKYTKLDMSTFLNNVTEEEFDESHIAVRHSTSIHETDNKAGVLSSIRSDLIERGFEQNYISSYTKEVGKLKPDDIALRTVKNEILTSFRYRDRQMTLKDLREDLTLQDITTTGVDETSKSALSAQIKLLVSQLPSYEDGLMMLLNELETLKTEVEYTPLSRSVSSVTRISPANKNDREDIYNFYQERYSLYDDLKNAMKEVLELWDDVEEEMEDAMDEAGQVTQKPTGRYNTKEQRSDKVEELDSEFKRMQELYNEMDADKNYIIKTGLLDYSIITNRDRSISASVQTTLLRALTDLLGKEELESHEEDFEDDEDYYQAQQNQVATIGEKQGENKPQAAQVNFREKTEEEVRQEQEYDELMDDLNQFNVIEQVDPLFIVAAHGGIIKNKYSISSWEKTKTELNNRLKDTTKNNPGAISIYRTALAEHEEYQEQAFDSGDRTNFYFPISSSVVSALQHIDDIELPLDKIEGFHIKLVTLISDLLEDPLEKSTIPIHHQPSDFAPGLEGKGEKRIPSDRKEQDRMKEQFNLIHSLKLGKKGKKRDVKQYAKFAESLTELFDIADRYYGDPIRELMIPYKTVPKYLDSDTLNALINHGPENVAQITLGLYREYYHSSVTPRDISKLTDYLVTSNSARKDAEDMEQKADRVLDVLKKMFPGNIENDINWFANEFKQQAKRDSSFDITGITLQNRKIEDMMFDKRKHKTSYHNVITMLYKFGGQFEKNHYTKKEYDKFKTAYKNQTDMKLASVHTKILEAHDEIRKMLGKPIYYNTCDLESFNHISDTIDIIKEQYKVELTGSDITGIVNEIDSMETIAKRYGVNSNAVYHVKAMFR